MRRTGWFLGIVLFAWIGAQVPPARAQANRLLAAGDPAYHTIERLQRRGHLLELNPTALPYRFGDLADALENLTDANLSPLERRWVDLLRRRLRMGATEEAPATFTAGVDAELGARLTDHQRLDPLRAFSDTARAYPYGILQLWLSAGPVVAEAGSRPDLFYNDDPMGLDVALRLGVRSEHTYAGVQTPYVSAYLGRVGQHWGLPGSDGMLISDNPLPYDLLALRLGTEKLAVRALLGELDSVTEDGRFTGRVADDSETEGNLRRFVAAHRWDWRPSKRLTLAFIESAIYSSETSGLSLKYLNPVHPFVWTVDNRPKNDENNGFVGGLLWAQTGRWTWHGQLVMDDFDILNSTEPASFALTGNLIRAAGAFDVGAEITMVATRTYNTDQPPGKYMYLLGGLATQFSDFIQGGVFADLYLDAWLPGLQLTPRLDVLAQGEVDFRDEFSPGNSDFGTILEGTVEQTVRPSVQVFYQRSPWWWIRLDGGLNVTSNKDHIDGASDTRFAGLATFGVRLTTQQTARATW